MKKSLIVAVLFLFASVLQADVSVTDRGAALRRFAGNSTVRGPRTNRATPEQIAETKAANQAKRDAKKKKRGGGPTSGISTSLVHASATGSKSLVDSAGLQYFINTDITFSTTSSASGAASEASFVGPVVASTSGGGTTTSTLNDSFDGYNTICVSLTNAPGPCATGNPNYVIYRNNGMVGFDPTVPATPACTNRQLAFPDQVIGAVTVSRKVFVPTNDAYIRWVNTFTNTSGAPVTFTVSTGNNMGSDSNTRIVSSSSGDNVAQLTDTWVSTFQNFSGSTSSDPRLGHVLQGTGAPTPLSNISFADGDDNPYWTYAITLAAGQTKSIVNFATGQGTKAAANAQAAALAQLPPTSTQCLSSTEIGRIVNFALDADLSITKTASPAGSVNAGQQVTYTIAVTNSGPATASNVTVTDVLPAGATYVSGSGAGWTCNEVASTVTCTMPSLGVGAASPITLIVTAGPGVTSLTNTATVSSSTTDGTPGNNASTTGAVTVVPAADLAITKSASPAGSVNAGQNVTYTLQVSNLGPSTATAVTVTDPLPAGATFVSASGTGWSCSQAAGTVTCTMPSLAVGVASPITIVVTAPNTAATLNNTATVSSTTADPVPGNNSSTSSNAVASSADLSITKTANSASATGGTPITYTLAVTNLGPTLATNVSVVDILPAGSIFGSATGTGWTCSNAAGTVTCTRPTLAVGAAPPITLTFTPASPATPGTLVNTATVSSTSPDPTPGNNSSTSTVALAPQNAVPTLSTWMLLALGTALALIALRQTL